MNEIDSISTNLTTLTISTEVTTAASASEPLTGSKVFNKDANCFKKFSSVDSPEVNDENHLSNNARVIDSSVDFSLNSSFEDYNLNLSNYDKKIRANNDTTKIDETNNLLSTNQPIVTNAETNKEVKNNYSSMMARTRKKHFADIRCFTFFMCLIVMLTNALIVGYRNSVITTIEKRFEFSSVLSGILSGCLEFGSLIGN